MPLRMLEPCTIVEPCISFCSWKWKDEKSTTQRIKRWSWTGSHWYKLCLARVPEEERSQHPGVLALADVYNELLEQLDHVCTDKQDRQEDTSNSRQGGWSRWLPQRKFSSRALMTRDQCKASSSSCCCCCYWCNHNFHITSQGQQHDCWAPFKIESNVRKKKERNKTRSFRAVREGDQSRELTPLRPQEIWLLRRLKGSSAALSLSGGVEGTTKAKGFFTSGERPITRTIW